jgi:putative flippase GtrA
MIPKSVIIYGGISAICFVLNNIILIFGDYVGWPLLLSVMTSFCLVALIGYLLHSLMTFQEPLRPLLFARYATAMSANIPLAFAVVAFWHTVVRLPMIWASPIATTCLFAVNYVLSRWAIKSRANRHG